MQIRDSNKQGMQAGHAVVFTWAGDGPHPAIEHMLDVMDIESVRTTFEGEDAIVGFLGDRCAQYGPQNPASIATAQFLHQFTRSSNNAVAGTD